MNWCNLEIVSIVAITGIAQGIFLSGALLAIKRGERLVNRILVCLIAVFTLDILFSIISVTFFLPVNHCIRFLYGPVIYFYTEVLHSHSFYFKKKDIIHFSPFFFSLFFVLLFSFPFSGILPGSFPLSRGFNFNGIVDMVKMLFYLSVFIHLGSYLFYCYKKIAGQQKSESMYNKNYFYNQKILLCICFVYNVLCLMSSIIRIIMINPGFFAYLPPLFLTFIIYLYGYITILKPQILFITWNKGNNHSVYKKIHLSEQKSKEYLTRLLSIMETEKLYTDPDLTLPLLADRVHISRNLLSYLLNSVLGINFYDFINGFRIEAVKNLLTDTSLENENILNIAFHAGFNSKSAFNKIFKKHTNMSPSQYKKVSLNKTKDAKIFSHIMELNLVNNFENGYGIKSVYSGTS